MKISTYASLLMLSIPPIFASYRLYELTRDLVLAIWFLGVSFLFFYVIAMRIRESLESQETELIATIYQKTYERSIRFVPVISFLAISLVALYTLAPLVVVFLIPFIGIYSGLITYSVKYPFYSSKIRAFLEAFKSFLAAAFVPTLGFLLGSYFSGDLRGFIIEHRTRFYLSLYELIKNTPSYLHDSFIIYSPWAALIAALTAFSVRAGAKLGASLTALVIIILFYMPQLYHLFTTIFVFLVALYERSSMKISEALIVPDIGSLSRIVPLGFTIVMTFIGGSLEIYINVTLVPAAFISLLSLLSLILGLVLMRYFLKIPTISGMKLGMLRL